MRFLATRCFYYVFELTGHVKKDKFEQHEVCNIATFTRELF